MPCTPHAQPSWRCAKMDVPELRQLHVCVCDRRVLYIAGSRPREGGGCPEGSPDRCVCVCVYVQPWGWCQGALQGLRACEQAQLHPPTGWAPQAASGLSRAQLCPPTAARRLPALSRVQLCVGLPQPKQLLAAPGGTCDTCMCLWAHCRQGAPSGPLECGHGGACCNSLAALQPCLYTSQTCLLKSRWGG